MDKGKHSKRYPQGSMAALNWKQLQGFMREDRRNSRQSRAHRLEALQEIANVGRPARGTVASEARMEAEAADALCGLSGILDEWLQGRITARKAIELVRTVVFL